MKTVLLEGLIERRELYHWRDVTYRHLVTEFGNMKEARHVTHWGEIVNAHEILVKCKEK
jgi:hypothetical protein